MLYEVITPSNSRRLHLVQKRTGRIGLSTDVDRSAFRPSLDSRPGLSGLLSLSSGAVPAAPLSRGKGGRAIPGADAASVGNICA